jgi:glycosyltransferase involved in cell wall biosynthesis
MRQEHPSTPAGALEPRVVFYFGVFAPLGGIERFAVNLLNGLADLGLKARLVYSAKPGWSPQGARFDLVRAPYLPGCRYHVSDWLLFFFFGRREIRQASCVIFGKMPPAWILRILKKWRRPGCRFIFVTPYSPTAPATTEEAARLVASLAPYDIVVVQAEGFRQTLLDAGLRVPIEIVPYSVDEEIERLPTRNFPDAPPWRIGFLGRLEAQKSLDILINAFSTLARSDLELHLYGSGSHHAELQELAAASPAASRIFFHGAVSHATVPQVVAENHLFAFSSREEGQPVASLEIFACGRPIAATPAGALAEMLADPRLGFCAGTTGVPAMAEALSTVLERIEQGRLTPPVIREVFAQRWSRAAVLSNYVRLLTAT